MHGDDKHPGHVAANKHAAEEGADGHTHRMGLPNTAATPVQVLIPSRAPWPQALHTFPLSFATTPFQWFLLGQETMQWHSTVSK